MTLIYNGVREAGLRHWIVILVGSMGVAACTSVSKYGHSYSIESHNVYKSVDGSELTADVFRPRYKGLKPAVLVVHGGGWQNRSGDMNLICADLAKAGFVAFNITYRLGPKGQYPKAVDDVRDSMKWIHDNAAKFDVEPDKIGGWGYSAGAHLILLAGLDPKNGLKAIVSGGTPADLPAWPNSPLINAFIGQPLATHRALWEEASPVNHVRSDSPPVFLYHGKTDDLVEIEQMHKMRTALENKHVHAETHTVNHAGHIAVYLFSRESIDLGIRFLKQNLDSRIREPSAFAQ